MTIKLFHDDCLQVLPTIKDKINLVVVDLPYGQTACSWDSIIDLKQMWIELKKICTKGCVYVFFCTTKFGYKLIQSNEKWFRYDLVWEKSRKVGFLSANKMPLRKHEMVYVFADLDDDLDNSKNLELRAYAEKVKLYINKTSKQIITDIGSRKAEHFIDRFKTTQFGLPTIETYNKLIELYGIDKMEGFRALDDLKKAWDCTVYNPQKTKGKPWKTKGGVYTNQTIYGHDEKPALENKTGDRHPTSILPFPETPDEQEPRAHEMLYVFADLDDDLDNSKNLELRAYAEKVKLYINKPNKQIEKDIGNMGISHFYSFKSTQFGLPTNINYNKLIELYGIDKMEGFRTLDDLKKAWDCTVYNPQKTKGKPYKTNGGTHSNYYRVEGTTYTSPSVENKTGDRHPTSIVLFNNPVKSLHRTEKPVDLCEWIIKSYSNEGDTVLDFTMGSGTAGVACINTKRHFIGIEKDDKIYQIAQKRIFDHEVAAALEAVKVSGDFKIQDKKE